MPQPEKELDPGASPEQWFGSQVRKHRKMQGLSATQLGKLVQVSGDMILSIEWGKYPSCQREVAVRLDEVLGTGELFTDAWPMVFGLDAEKRQRDADKHPVGRREETAQATAGRILEGSTPTPPGSNVDRRAFLATSSLAAVPPAHLASLVTPSTPPELPGNIASRDIADILNTADHIHREDNAHGGGGMVGVIANSALHWAVRLLAVPRAEQHSVPLHSAVARLGIVVGASHFDAYAHDDARVAFKLAAACAEEAGDWPLRAKAYSFLARQAIWVGDPDTGLTYAEQGLVRADRLTPTIQAMLHSARARAFGKLGDVSATLAAVGAADDAFARSNPANDPPWMAYYDTAQHHGDTAHALYDLTILKNQDPARTGARFEIAVAGHSDAYARSRAISGTKWASLVMATGDPQQATEIGHRALTDAGNLTSRRAADDLRDLSRFAHRYRGLPEAAHLRERIRTTLST